MPEEINRLVTDSVADLLWTPSDDGDANLLREGVAPEKIQRVGNIMIDSLEMMRPKIEAARAFEELGVPRGAYAVVTLHRPSNVDARETLEPLVGLLTRLADRLPVVFPIHPRTRASLERWDLLEDLCRPPGMWCTEPLGYIAFMSLVFNCRLALTDSGGLQEETTYLGIPCLTLRENTERPVTVTQGTNRLCSRATVGAALEDILYGKPAPHGIPELWDGRTAQRIVERIRKYLGIADG